MKRPDWLLALPLMTLAACQPARVATNPPPIDGGVSASCDTAQVQGRLGQRYTRELGTHLMSESGARTLRVYRQGDAVTMDYRGDRLNVELDRGNGITALSCG